MRQTVFLLLAVGLTSMAFANDGRFDYARVIDAEPITVSERIAVRKQVCAKRPEAVPPGDARREQPQASIAELIRADTRRRDPPCRNVTDFDNREKIVGWRVTYRYGGANYVQRMKDKPGERIRVRIDIDAG